MSLRDIGRSSAFLRSRRSHISRRKAATRSAAVNRSSTSTRPYGVGEIAHHRVAQQERKGGVLVDLLFGRPPAVALTMPMSTASVE